MRGLVVDREGKVLLVRHTYCPGWHLPGGGVSKGESSQTGICRELMQEVGVETSEESLRVLNVSFSRIDSKHDHVLYYYVTEWTQISNPWPSLEIADAGFFSLSELPVDVSKLTRMAIEVYLESK